MKVVQINATYGIGSTGFIVKDIDELLTKKGIASYVVTPIATSSSERIINIGNALDRKWHALMTRILGHQCYGSKTATKKMLKKLDAIKPDIVHLHNLHSNYINFNLLFDYLEKNDIHTVITLHDCWFFTGKCFHYVAEGCDKWKTECFACPRNKKDVPSVLFDKSKSVYKDKKYAYSKLKNLYVVSVSKWMQSQVRQSILNVGQLHQIYNGIDLSIFYDRGKVWSKEQKIDNKFIILGMANKWFDDKNKKALDKVIDSLDNQSILILVGGSNAEIKSDKVYMIDFVSDRDELAKIYSSADVFVNLTWEDSLPTVNMEALACGTPVVTYDSCGSPEIINKDTGLIIPQGDINELMNAIQLIKKNGKFLYAEHCTRRAKECFEKETQYEKYIALYRQICEENK